MCENPSRSKYVSKRCACNDCRRCNTEYAAMLRLRHGYTSPERAAKSESKTNARARLLHTGAIRALYLRLHEEQQGLCAICGKNDGKFTLAIDHDHATGAVRKLLCRRCNMGLGWFSDSPALLRAAAQYVEAHAPAKPKRRVVRRSV